jgi:hypothetical protein
LDDILKYLGIAWSVVAFVAVVAFFAGDHWTTWKEVRKAHDQELAIFGTQPDLGELEAKIQRLYQVLALAEMPDGQGRSKYLEEIEARVKQLENVPAISLPDFGQFVKVGDRVILQGKSQLYLYDNDGQGQDEKDLLMNGVQDPWIIRKAN